MMCSRLCSSKLLFTGLLAASLCIASATAEDNPLRFQRPGRGGETTNTASQQKFRAPEQAVALSAPAPVANQPVVKKVAAKPPVRQPAAPVATPRVAKQPLKRDTRVRRAQSEDVELHTDAETWEEPVYMDSMPMGDPTLVPHHDHMSGCQSESCMCDPGCGAFDPGCGMMDPGCGCAEPSCGVAGCGDPVRPRGPDYWCFPVCLPRLQDITFWGGVHGFRGPRDFIPAGRSDSNFGFQEGINLSGRAPLLGFLFPELNYQLGFQALQSRLHGTATSTEDRGQQFITAGLFRRTQSGLQFGAVYDSMRDDLDQDIDLTQVRYEISLKTPRGRELGFWGATATNDDTVGANTFESVDQYCGFYRWNFKGGNQGRIWGGATNDGEGILGADFYAPLNDRWSVQTGFNYLIPDDEDGLAGVSQESWNIGINLVWHWGRRAREGNCSPFRPLFSVADNGWMFVDRVD